MSLQMEDEGLVPLAWLPSWTRLTLISFRFVLRLRRSFQSHALPSSCFTLRNLSSLRQWFCITHRFLGHGKARLASAEGWQRAEKKHVGAVYSQKANRIAATSIRKRPSHLSQEVPRGHTRTTSCVRHPGRGASRNTRAQDIQSP